MFLFSPPSCLVLSQGDREGKGCGVNLGVGRISPFLRTSRVNPHTQIAVAVFHYGFTSGLPTPPAFVPHRAGLSWDP